MIRAISKKIESCLRKVLFDLFQLENYDLPEAAYPDLKMGDLSYTFAFSLAKTLKKNPKLIAQQLADAFPVNEIPELERVEVGGNGYLNFMLRRSEIASRLSHGSVTPEPEIAGKVIVEHTNINPNKAAHVGHLRNACLGDTLVRLLRFHGHRVEVQNYIDDTGVQLADVVLGFQRKGKSANDLDHITGKIDHYFWDLYSEIHQWIEQEAENKREREHVLKKMEERVEPTFTLSQSIADRIIRCHLATMARLGIYYELLPRESDIIGRKFWQRTFDLLKSKNAIIRVDEGKNLGCWVMRLSEKEDFEEMQNPDKVIVRSNGTVTYVGKDIAYQLWKFGLLGTDFYYRVFDKNPDGSTLWSTSTEPQNGQQVSFGGGSAVYNVIDQRQSYLQKVVAQGLRLLGYEQQSDRSIHFSYEMVTLSPKTAADLGFQLSGEEQARSFVEMSGRKGVGVKADDLLDRLEEKARERIAPLYTDLSETQLSTLASTVAVGALRYFMLRYTRNTMINFDMDDALSFEGETGPYLQYSLVRAKSILKKLSEAEYEIPANSEDIAGHALLLLEARDQESDDSWRIILDITKTRDIVAKTVRSLEISFFTKFVYQLAQSFNNYYHKYPILHEADEKRKVLRIAVVKMFVSAMETQMKLLGMPVPSRM